MTATHLSALASILLVIGLASTQIADILRVFVDNAGGGVT